MNEVAARIKINNYLRLSDKPTDNAFIESFNGSFRGKCLNLVSISPGFDFLFRILWGSSIMHLLRIVHCSI